MYKYGFTDLRVPSQSEPGSVATVLQQVQTLSANGVQKKTDRSSFFDSMPCLGITRKDFGTKEMNSTLPSAIKNTKHWNASHFQTLRWQYRSDQKIIGKTMADLSGIDEMLLLDEKTKFTPDIHNPISHVCDKTLVWNSDAINPFIAHHYSGTLEQVLFRSSDKRQANGTAYRMERYFKDQSCHTRMAQWICFECRYQRGKAALETRRQSPKGGLLQYGCS